MTINFEHLMAERNFAIVSGFGMVWYLTYNELEEKLRDNYFQDNGYVCWYFASEIYAKEEFEYRKGNGWIER